MMLPVIKWCIITRNGAMGATSEIQIATAKDYLSKVGLDLVVEFDLADYNDAIAGNDSLVRLEPFGEGHTRALIVANTRALWPHFVSAVNAESSLRTSKDPLDEYVSSRISAAAAMLQPDTQVYTAEMSHQPLVSMLTAGSVSGLGVMGPAMILVHPEHGPWIGIRGIIALDSPPLTTKTTVVDHCDGCSAPCKSALDAVLQSMKRPTVDQDNWRRWLTIREVCPVGMASKYGRNQTRYHYIKDRSALALDSE